MKPIIMFFILGIFGSIFSKAINAQQSINTNRALDAKYQSIVTISAFTANGDQIKLQDALKEGLNAGLTINEIKEVLVQLYAYAGFPRSLNALNTFIAVLKERKASGIKDQEGKDSSPLPSNRNRLQFGTELQTKLVGRAVSGEVYQFAPAIDQFLKEHLFGDIFGRDNLDWKTRELATIAALTSLGGAEIQLRSHFGVGMYNGLTAEQLHHVVAIIKTRVGLKEGHIAGQVLQVVLRPNEDVKKDEGHKNETDELIFPQGEKITNNNFIGDVWLLQQVVPDSSNKTQVGTVTFEAGARSNWHFHPAGQILMVISGEGYYQEKGSPKRILRKGDVVKCPPNIHHWHGASRDQIFIQVAITNTQNGPPVWLEPVTDEEYHREIK